MLSLFVALDLSSLVKQQLALLCYGLPDIEWIDQDNFHLRLRFIGPVNEQIEEQIKEALSTVSFLPFQLVLKGVDFFHAKSGQGTLWIGVQPNDALSLLKKDIDKALKGLDIENVSGVFKPSVLLGTYEKIQTGRLADYLAQHSLFSLPTLEIQSFTLFSTHQTAKRTFYQIIEEYPAVESFFSE